MSKDVTLVLGASSDVGRELLAQLAADGALAQAALVAHCHAGGERLKQLVREVPALGEAAIVAADLASADETARLVAVVRERFGCPNRIVHLPAPKLRMQRFKEGTPQDLQRELDVQLGSLTTVLRAFLPELAAQKRPGKVVVMLSSVTLGAPPAFMTTYTVAKYALLGLVRALAVEYAPKHVNVNAVSPSMMETAFLEQVPAKVPELAAAQNPWGRNARPADVAAVIRFLLGPGSDFVTGANVPVCGGAA